ncbi:adenylate/guanylate cyclase domain-containing protein [Candidatus Gracilibacteria bacterium]|nr:adenylate/guanylate cyclase domain-containing protein [Candidatus Gracilibacteria bacterium]
MKNIFKKYEKNLTLNNKFLVSLVISLGIVAIIILLYNDFFGDFFTRLNLNLQNGLYEEKYSNNKKPNSSLTVVEIDDKTLIDKDKGGLGRWQDFSRANYAKVIDNLTKDGAIVIGIDVLFSEKAITSNADKILEKSIKNAGNVILSFHYINNLYPIDNLKNVAYGIGDVLPIVNKYNNTIYSIFPFYFENGNILKSLSFSVLDKYYSTILGKKQEIKMDDFKKDYLKFYNINIPLKNSFENEGKINFLINYIPSYNSYQKISFVDVYNSNYNKSLVKDKIILIGSTATALHDEFNTPLGIMPGVYTHVNAINTILNKKIINYISINTELIALLFFIFIITLLGVYDRHKYYFIVSLFILSISYFKLYQFVFLKYNTIFSIPIYFFISILLSFIFVNLYKYAYEGKGKRVLKDALSQYLAEDLVSSVLNNFEKINLDGDKKEISIFFSDIAGFTTLSETMTPHDLMNFLKIYLKETSDVIIDNKGFINKYEGDAIMALWGTFGDGKKQVYNACRSAIEQQRTIDKLNERFEKEYNFKVSVRMGLNKGDAIVGNIGSLGRKIEYTAIGDNVNLASRLEGVNKQYNTKICVSESIRDEGINDFIFRKLDLIKVKGKKNSVNIYELIGYKNEINNELISLIKDFEKALSLYFEKKFSEAKEIFRKLENLGDEPSKIFVKRCNYLISNPIENWDGSWEFSVK